MGMTSSISGRRSLWLGLLSILILMWGCAHHQPLPQEPFRLVFKAQKALDETAGRWAPSFVVYGRSQAFNLIGRPSAVAADDGTERVFVDPDEPVVYFMKRSFRTRRAAYTNLIYRVHFPKVPFSLVPFNLSAGRNTGLIVVVTLNAQNRPVLVTSVHTCGCYKAIVPTQYLPPDALPKDWTGQKQRVYGETLPGLLHFPSKDGALLLVHLRPGVHRVMDLEVQDRDVLSSSGYQVVPMEMAPVDALLRLPLDGGSTSFYHRDGVLQGHVKGAVKPLETLFLSLISLDLFVGTDKIYGDAAETGNRFYTSLKPWRRDDSDMWDFAGFLAYWGWRL